MELAETSKRNIKKYLENPDSEKGAELLDSAYWDSVKEFIHEIISNKEDVSAVLDSEESFINLGLSERICRNPEEVQAGFVEGRREYSRIEIFSFTDWLKQVYKKAHLGFELEKLEQDIKKGMLNFTRIKDNIEELQNKRERIVVSELQLREAPKKLLGDVKIYRDIDKLFLENYRIQRSVAGGKVYTVDERKAFANREKKLQVKKRKLEALHSFMESSRSREVVTITKRVDTLIQQSVECLLSVKKLQAKKDELEKKEKSIDPEKVKNFILSEVEHIQEMLKLSAGREHMKPCAMLDGKRNPFSYKTLYKALDTVFEFDPGLFSNNRVKIFGKPTVLILAGTGNALYDWKYNLILLPVVPAAGSLSESLSSAVIEYRMDADEEKVLINSYHKLKSTRDIRSFIELRKSLVKDYKKWITMEYNGFKVLPGDKKEWFEREIGPSSKEVFVPFEYRDHEIEFNEAKKMIEPVEKSDSSEGLKKLSVDILWLGGILLYQFGKYQKSFMCFSELKNRGADSPFIYFNRFLAGMKAGSKQEVKGDLKRFRELRPKGWWANKLRDRMREINA
ncbi:MAG: hypothetical protein ACOCSE_01770 [Chitinivibrionales bacterium]